MKKIAFALFIVFLSLISISAQSAKSDNKLTEIEKSIIQIESKIKEKTDKKRELLTIYKSQHPEIRTLNSEIEVLASDLSLLNEQKKELLTAEWLKSLPNNQIELLKIIISQNEKIIKLLEKQQKP